jgi:hypothetical protein
MKKRLQKYDFKNKPKQSLYGALTVGSAKFLYNFENPKSKVNFVLKDQKDDALSKADNLRAT